jgi:hypothetical protein
LASSLDFERDIGLGPGSVESLKFGRRDVAEGLVQAVVVEPADVFDDAELELGRVRQTRSATSSVLKLSTKLSERALS